MYTHPTRYSATIFAFGQTGSGKTFTITGPEGAQTSDTQINITKPFETMQ
ncbi:hypothetical protein BDEG_22255 [Batrachochytrium dendrobatidis JEL423]|uniref:Kinesin motor domain-containing protein n=1 Tax=Batrachochytrium dendrobatidis (strain JEL423) TaxID=403673 RepID=A0A177WDW9_BATDL|nr:hypothetical protein BDEG_22255 [Batrachochytrium dendrobatidis JEL423]